MPWFAYSCPLSGRNQSSEVPCYFALLRWGCLEKCCIVCKGLWSKDSAECGKSSGSCRDPLVQGSGISGVEQTREIKPHRSTASSQTIPMSRATIQIPALLVKKPFSTKRAFKIALEGMHSPMGNSDTPLLHVCQSCSGWAVKARVWRETRLHESSCFPTDAGRGEKQMTPLLFQ